MGVEVEGKRGVEVEKADGKCGKRIVEAKINGEAVGPATGAPKAAEEAPEPKLGKRPRVEGPIRVLGQYASSERILRRQLDLAGFIPTVANNGAEALETFERSGPGEIDVILMDVEMPVMDGMKATRRIREHEKGAGAERDQNVDGEGVAVDGMSSIPILGLSGNARYEYRERALEAGMNDYVVKPYDRSALFEKIETWATKTRERAHRVG
ncbi:CheY-like superfamily [Jimgerdemannia flammicorona]|uniref:CheY-like superfamily n=1 Tax=Jimgerdemannia flammicorona TaxID=994334 RepID=A0A433PRR7_9FUNG|nr:CheY-like superfamily [Jimgerdemannia flammicorona]